MGNILDTIMGFLTCPGKRQQAEADLVAALLKVEAWETISEKAQEQAQRYFEQAQADRILLGEVQSKLNAFTEADLAAIIRQLGPRVTGSMNPAAYGRVWWECLKALGGQFKAPIEYVEWGPFEVWNQILAAYPNIKLKAGFRGERYRVLTEPDMVVAIVDRTYVRWVEYELDWRDCDALGERFRSHLNIEYKVNSVADVDGTKDGGSHNFNLVPTVGGLVMVDVLSMARCAPVPPGLPGYIPTDVITL